MVILDTNRPTEFNDGNTGSSADFEYDDYGNLIIDRNKGITEITYNHLNLPKKITFDNNEFDGTIEYLYDANGTKLKKIVTDNNSSPVTVSTTHYLDGFQYSEDKMEFFPTTEGYVDVAYVSGSLGSPPTPTYNYVFNYTDHLGNIRLRYAINPVNHWLEILEEDHYYPFGLKHNGYNAQNYVFGSIDGGPVELIPTNPNLQDKFLYKFNGMEWQKEFDINVYDFGARNYDAALGRWMNIDNVTEKFPGWSPYNYCMQNPVNIIDPDGNDIFPVNNPQFVTMMLNAVANTTQGNKMLSEYINSSSKHLYIMTSENLKGVRKGTLAVTLNIYSKKGTTITRENARTIVRNQLKKDGNRKLIGTSVENNLVHRILMFEGTELKSGNNSLIAMDTEALFNYGENRSNSKGKYIDSGFRSLIEAFFHEPKAHASNSSPDALKEHKNFANTDDGLYDSEKSEGTILDAFLTELQGHYEGENATWVFEMLLKFNEEKGTVENK